MKEINPFKLLKKMEEHYNELIQNYLGIKSIQDFLSDDIRKKAILFDLFQIGEQMTHLPKTLTSKLNEKDIAGLISIRNHIVHGYDQLDYEIIKNAIEQEIHPFIELIKYYAIIDYHKQIQTLIGKTTKVFIDRPKGTVHKGIVYKLNYGYIKDIIAPDYEYQDAYVVGLNEPINNYVEGKAIAIIHRKDDIEDKLVISIDDKNYSLEEITEMILFQEKFFNFEVIKK